MPGSTTGGVLLPESSTERITGEPEDASTHSR